MPEMTEREQVLRDLIADLREECAEKDEQIEQQEMELEILRGAGGNFSFTPSDDYNLLLKQSKAMAGLIRSLEGQRDIQTARMIGMERRLAETDRSELDALRNTNEMLTNEAEQQAKEIEALRKLIADIKAWDVDQFITLPHALRERMQAVLDNAEQTGQ